MTYIELINEFWKQDMVDSIPPLEAKFYWFLLNECNKRKWINPFELQPRNLELGLMITRKTIGEVRNKLKQRGMIDFIAGKNKATVYLLKNVEPNNEELLNCFPQVTISKQLGLQLVNNSGYNQETNIEDIRSKSKDTTTSNNSSSRTHAREESQLGRFDSMLQEIYDGRHQIWESQVCKNFRIDSVREYLPSFRDHAIINSSLGRMADIDEVKSYFVNSFRYFTRVSETEQLNLYLADAMSEDFRAFCCWLAKDAPNVAKMIYPLSEDEFHRLKETFGSERIFLAILNLNNRIDLLEKYFSLYRTLINWLNNERDK